MVEQDRIGQTFRDATIFITGGTGFLGKIYIEKFLRCCEVKKVLLLVRMKKGKTPKERLDDIFKNMLFDELKSKNPSALKKCQIVPGDITQEGLGISPEDRQLIQEEVEFIIHSAASTRFDDSVKTAVIFNTRSTKEVLDLAESCKKLKTLVHVSTAYAFPKEKVLYDKPYKVNADPHKVLDKVKFGKAEDIEKLLGDCPNTYTFSKALAEVLVVERMDKVPAIIIRPSIVCPIAFDPVKGWCNTLQGPMGLFVGAGKGIIRSMYMNADSYADFIPADVVINLSLVAIWKFLNVSKKDRIYNATSSSEYNISWEELINLGKDIIYNDVPFNGVVWYPGGSIKKSKIVHNICFYLLQLLPAIFIDALLFLLGYKPILYQIQRRIQKGGDVFEYYTNRPWNFSNLKLQELRPLVNDTENRIYKIDGDGIDLREYLKDCIKTVRVNNLKETPDTIPQARRHMNIMWTVDIICKVLFVVAALYYAVLKPLAIL